MKIRVANYLKVKDADIEVNSVTLVAGPNYAGKTSLAGAIGLALTGDALPDGNLPKWLTKPRLAKAILRHGSKEAMVHVKNRTSSVSVVYPKCLVSSTGEEPPRASRIAVGFERVMNMKPAERQAFFADLLKSDPKRDILISELKPAKMSNKQLDDLWNTIKVLGWDSVHQTTRMKGAEMKGAWEQCTGEAYGKLKAETWMPDGWKPELININVKELTQDIADKKKFIEVALKETAVSGAELGKLTELAEKLPELEQENTEKYRKTIELDAKLNVLREREPKLIHIEASQSCPYCENPLEVVLGIVKAVEKISDAKLKKDAAELKKLRAGMEALKVQIKDAQNESLRAKLRLGEAKVAAEKMKELNFDTEENKSDVNIETAKARLEESERDLRNYNVKQEADRLHSQIMRQSMLVTALAPEGIRLKVLNDDLAKINLEIRELTAPTEWELFKFDEEMNVMYGDIHYVFCSLSEKLWINTVLQVIVARRDGSNMIIVDEFDTFMWRQRTWMMKFFKAAGIPVLILMSMNKREDLPDLSNMGWNSYWIEKGEIKG